MSNIRPILLCEDHLEYSKAYKWLIRRTELNSNDKIVYTRLRNCTYEMGEYWVSQEYLSHECGFSVDTVQRALKKLEKLGLISKIQHGKKMFNSYQCHIHEWMTDENKFKKSEGSELPILESDTANPRITNSDTADPRVVTPQIRGSIYKEQNKEQNISSIFSEIEIDGSDMISPMKENQQRESNISIFSKNRWKEFSGPFESKSRTGDCDKKLNKLCEKEYDHLLNQRNAYLAYVKTKRKKWKEFPMKDASTFLNPKYWRSAEWISDKSSECSIYDLNVG